MSEADLATADRGPQLIAMYWACGAFAVLAVTLRFVGRVMIKAVGWDDWVMLFTLFMYIGLASFSTAMAVYGGCKHSAFIPPDHITYALRYNYAAQTFGIFGYATGKASIALLTLRILGPNTKVRRWILYVLVVLSFVFSIVNIILTFAQCSPPSALWNPMLLATGQATCWNPAIQSDFGIFLGSWNIAADVVLAVLPITIFYNLQISLMQKISCSVLLSLGLLAAVFGAIKAATLGELTARSDLSWETFPLFAWSGAELFVLILCGSVPPMKPIYDRLMGKQRNTRKGYTSYADQDAARILKSRNTKKSHAMYDTTATIDSTHEELTHESRNYAMSPIKGHNGTEMGRDGILRTTEVSITSHPV